VNVKRKVLSNVNSSLPKCNFEGNAGTYVFGRCRFLALTWPWNDVRTKMRVYIYFNSLRVYIHRTHVKLRYIMNSDTLLCIWIPVFPIGIFEVSTARKWGFWLYFISIHDYLHPNPRNSLVHNSWSEMERREKRAFQLLKMRKMNIRWNINIKYVSEVFLSIRSSSMNYYTCH